ncbi:substrate import-associated zinc metallohydrolase lipoprotein [Pedobacter cryoconitis]|uniref:Substrate import-associated zinc metallohydrolase lipoprotein n=1 Tax=Pedobacter cryoconitis TaxID=188932 RepID=A0A7X0MIT1_9SPHI|nr:substrate import-associated zinc metallohydrolase lipoprotein [Pedobacter cryoconitis]MBB6498768.1 substrate import-associated zinc metallohydrolase lipoprotein [Pedobacter cryoconitis]
MKTILKIRNIKLILLASIAISIFSCKKNDKLVLQDNYLGGEVSGKTALDSALNVLLVKPYNIEVKYKWDQSQFDKQYTIVPPRVDKVLPAMTSLKQVWIDPYNAETGSDLFMKTYSPKQLILAGSPILTKDGNGINGLAEGGLDILLSDINSTDPKDKAKVSDLLHLIHHEFTHILNQKKAYTTDFNVITPSDYIADWYNSPVNPLALGFISGYARKEPVEDFAETVSWMLTWGKDYYENTYLKQSTPFPDPALYPAGSYYTYDPNAGQYYKVSDLPAILKVYNGTLASISPFFIKELVKPDYSAGVAKLRKKEAIVVAYFKSAYNIDFYSLQTNVQKSLANATK